MKVRFEFTSEELNAVNDAIGTVTDGGYKIKPRGILADYPGLVVNTEVENGGVALEANVNPGLVKQVAIFVGGMGTFVLNFIKNAAKEWFGTCTFTYKDTGKTTKTNNFTGESEEL